MTQMVQMRPEAADGIVPLGNTIPDEDGGFDSWFNELAAQKANGTQRR
jgi:hypothetical protein